MTRILSLIPAEPGWVATVYYNEKDDDGRRTVTGTERHRVHGWALVDHDGVTSLEPMYVESPGFPTCASLHNSYAPDEVTVYAHHEPGATDLTEPRTDHAEAVRTLASGALGYVQAQQNDPVLYDMLSALCRALDGDDADALKYLGAQRAEAGTRGQLADRQRDAWGLKAE